MDLEDLIKKYESWKTHAASDTRAQNKKSRRTAITDFLS